MKKTIYLLHGDNAVDCYNEKGINGCIKQGYNNVSVIEFTKEMPVSRIVQTVLNSVSGSLDSCIITKTDYEKIIKAFN